MIIVEIDSSEFKKHHFDKIWDEIRDIYESDKYSLKTIEESKGKYLVKLNVIKKTKK
jgi:hypothetical protein